MGLSIPVRTVGEDHRVIHLDPFAYSAHPHLCAAGAGNWLVVFTQTRRRAGLRIHPPQDPMFVNLMIRSADEGRTWSEPCPVPDFGWSGVECAGLTALGSGEILLNQWQFGWHTLAHARAHLRPEEYVTAVSLLGSVTMAEELGAWTPEQRRLDERFPWARVGGRALVHRSTDGGRTFAESVALDTGAFSGGYGMRGGVEVDGAIVLPLSDVPNYRAVFIVRSGDGGNTWSEPQLVAAGDGLAFEEPAPLLLRSGRILLMLRENISREMHAVWSDDAGASWSRPVATGLRDYPADLALLPDGRIVCAAGRRRPPFGITLHVSEDAGASWNAEEAVFVRDGLPSADLGYPSIALRPDGSLLVVYYAEDADGVTGIHSTTVPAELLAGRPAHGFH